MAYTYDAIFAVDPNSPSNVARNASILIFDPNDTAKTPVTLTDITGSPITNPITVNQHGFGPAIQHETLDRLAWEGAGMSGVFTSYEGMKEEAVAARVAAQTAATEAGAAAQADLEARIAAGQFKGEPGVDGTNGVNGSNVLPTDTAIKNAITTPGTETATALSAAILDRVSRVANVTGYPLASALSMKYGDVTVGLAGDSTGANVDGWFRLLMEDFGANDPALKVVYKDWEENNETILTTTVQAGQSRYVVVKEDKFDRTAANLYGSMATTGNSTWFGNSGGSGDWSVDGTAAVATSDTSLAEVTLSMDAMANSRTVANLEAVSAYVGASITHDFIIRRASSTDSLRVRISYDNTANTYQATLRQTIAGTVTTLVTGAVTAMPADRKFALTVDVIGTAVAVTVNGTAMNAAMTDANAAILNAGTQQGFQRFGNTTGDRITFFSVQRIDPPRTLTAYNGSLSGSTLDYQQPLLAQIFPVPLDILFISSIHNYGADRAATYTEKLHSFVTAAQTAQPDAGIVISSQNPKYGRFSGDQRDAQRERCVAARNYALSHKYGYVPILEAFDAEPDGGRSLILPDDLHPTLAGSKFWAGVVKDYIASLTVSGTLPELAYVLTKVTSDTFTGGDATTVTGRTTDAALGGTGKVWEGGGTAFAISGGVLVRGADVNTNAISLAGNPDNVEVSVKVVTIGTNTHYMFCRRADTSGASNRYQVRIAGSTVCLSKRLNNAYADIGTAKTIVAGDVVAVRAMGTKVQLRINGVIVDEVTDTDVTAGGYCGILVGGSGSAFGFDDFTIDAVTIAA